MSDDAARRLLADPRAPADERRDAEAQLQKSYRPLASELIPAADIQAVIDQINDGLELDHLAKGGNIALDNLNRHRPAPKAGMQSVALDDMQLQVSGDFFEKPAALSLQSLRDMVERTPILSAVVMTRVRQVQRFCAPSEDGGVGFAVRHADKKHEADLAETQHMALLTKFFANCGWEFNPRARKKLKRTNLSTFMAMSVRDSLAMDAAPIETEMKRDATLGMDGFYAVDGETIRLCTEEGYQGDDELYAVQVVQGRVVSAYSHDDLIYEPRNPRSTVTLRGYGLGETELLIKTVTGFLLAMDHNQAGFDRNSIPKGLLQIVGEYGPADIAAFKRQWNAMVRGINNAWALPVLFSGSSDGKATFEKFGIEHDEMLFARWMTFLTSLICAVYGMSPDEINFESFSAGRSSLSGSDTEEKLSSSKDKGLRPLLSHYEQLFSDYICSAFDERYVFRWIGLDEEDAEKAWEARKLVLTVDELRKEEGYSPHPDPLLGAAPVNPQLVGPWLQLNHPPAPEPGTDFGGQGDGTDYGNEDGAPGNEPGDEGLGDGAPGGGPPEVTQPGSGGFGGPEPEGEFGKALAVSATAIYSVK